MIITAEILKEIAPGSKNTNYKLLPELALWMTHTFPEFSIDAPNEYCHFLAQAAHETDSFNSLEEYASGQAYEGRKDLGNINPGDGKKYKGRGIFQTTGLNNYHRLDIKLGGSEVSFELNPELLERPQYAVWSACIFWDDHNFNDIAAHPDKPIFWSKKLNKYLTPLEYITYRINGSIKTVPQRQVFYNRCKKIFI
jgi:putative chitinase